jgi:drug/metabolite transporter (DMT)-like permease
MLLSWQVLVTITVVTFSLGALLQRLILRTAVRPIAYAIFTQLLSAGLLIIFGLLTGQLKPFALLPIWWSVGAMALLYGAGSVVVAMALKITEASKFAVLFASRGLVTMLVTTLILQENLPWLKWVGAGLIFVGVVCASWETKRLSLQKGDILALIAAVFLGLANANDRFILQHMPVYTYLVLAYLLPALVVAVWKPTELHYLKEFFRPPLFNKILLLNILFVIATATFYAAMFIAPSGGQVAMISLTSVILIVGLSVIFLKERSHLWQKFLGAVLGFMGLLLLN